MLEQRIQQHFFDSADLMFRSAEGLSTLLASAVGAITGCLTAGGKLLVCASGGSAGLAQQFTAHLVGRFERERPPLAALALGIDAGVLGSLGGGTLADIFAKQVQALGNPGDVLLVFATPSEEAAVAAALGVAREKDMTIVALTARDGGTLKALLSETDVLIAVPHEQAARVREIGQLALHCLCDAIDTQLLGEQDLG